jgi:hypothetical protein
VFTARYAPSPYVKQMGFVFKGITKCHTLSTVAVFLFIMLAAVSARAKTRTDVMSTSGVQPVFSARYEPRERRRYSSCN